MTWLLSRVPVMVEMPAEEVRVEEALAEYAKASGRKLEEVRRWVA